MSMKYLFVLIFLCIDVKAALTILDEQLLVAYTKKNNNIEIKSLIDQGGNVTDGSKWKNVPLHEVSYYATPLVTGTRGTFLYFAYGSNLWTKRIHLQNPNAIRKGIAQLVGYRLDFWKPRSKAWNGSPATVIEDGNHTTWGAVYEIDSTHLTSLDAQEGVHENYYVPLIKEVITPDGEVLECRLYQLTKNPTNAIDLSNPLNPYERKPSKTYLNVICRGAEESQLPEKYIDFLKSIAHNDEDAHPDMLKDLEL